MSYINSHHCVLDLMWVTRSECSRDVWTITKLCSSMLVHFSVGSSVWLWLSVLLLCPTMIHRSWLFCWCRVSADRRHFCCLEIQCSDILPATSRISQTAMIKKCDCCRVPHGFNSAGKWLCGPVDWTFWIDYQLLFVFGLWVCVYVILHSCNCKAPVFHLCVEY